MSTMGVQSPSTLATLRIVTKMKDLLIYSAYYWWWFAFHSKVEDPQVEQISLENAINEML